MNNLLSTKELAKYLSVSIKTIYNWNDKGMPHKKIGYNVIRYNLDEVMNWLDEYNNR